MPLSNVEKQRRYRKKMAKYAATQRQKGLKRLEVWLPCEAIEYIQTLENEHRDVGEVVGQALQLFASLKRHQEAPESQAKRTVLRQNVVEELARGTVLEEVQKLLARQDSSVTWSAQEVRDLVGERIYREAVRKEAQRLLDSGKPLAGIAKQFNDRCIPTPGQRTRRGTRQQASDGRMFSCSKGKTQWYSTTVSRLVAD